MRHLLAFLERRHRRRTVRYVAHHHAPAVTTIQPNRKARP